MKKIVSYAYFRSPTSVYEKEKGNSAVQFEQFFRMLVRAHYCVWRGYEMRVHVDEAVQALPLWPTLVRYHNVGLLKLVPCGVSMSLCTSMLWRLHPVFDNVDDQIVVCRDVDSVPMLRDRLCVEEWLATGKAVHVIHDNAAHSGVMGGTLAVRSHRFRELLKLNTMDELLNRGTDLNWSAQGADQHLLNQLLPMFAESTLVHELHHRVNDMGSVAVRDFVVAPGFLFDGPSEVLSQSDGLCSTVGGCTDPGAALAFYDHQPFPELDLIRKCEINE